MKRSELKELIKEVLDEDISDPKIRGPLRNVKGNIEVVILMLKRAKKYNETLDTESIGRILSRLTDAAASLNKLIGKN